MQEEIVFALDLAKDCGVVLIDYLDKQTKDLTSWCPTQMTNHNRGLTARVKIIKGLKRSGPGSIYEQSVPSLTTYFILVHLSLNAPYSHKSNKTRPLHSFTRRLRKSSFR